ncbi:MAG: hypothetical protein ACUVWN_08100 [bacterium]
MDIKAIISLGLAALLGFLFFPRSMDQTIISLGREWVPIKDTITTDPLRGTTLRRDNPVVKTYDLGFIYRIDRAEVTFSGLPKDYDILTSKIRNASPYDRPISTSSTLRGEYTYPIVNFPPKEARWVQVVVNDWYSTRPDIKSVKIGARYESRNPIKSVRTKYNPEESVLLFDGLKSDSAPKWICGKRVTKKENKSEISYEPPNREPIDITFDLGGIKLVYGSSVTTGGNENNLKQYRLFAGVDDRSLKQIYVSPELENKTVTDVFKLNNPIQARYVQLVIDHGKWYGLYPELREVEIYTDDYRPSNYYQNVDEHNAVQFYYDNCGADENKFAQHLIQGFPFDRGEGLDPQIRYSFKPGEEVDNNNTPEERSFCYHYDSVIFSYSDLDPNALYWVRVTYLQEKGGKRIQNLDVDGFILHDSMEIPEYTAKKFIYPIPPEAYSDGKIELHFNRVSGLNAVVSEVMIYRASKGGTIPIVYEGDKTGENLISRAPKLAEPVLIDGKLDDWPDIYPIVPQRYITAPASSPCQLFIQWDDNNLFIAFKADRRKLSALSGSSSYNQAPDSLHLFIDTNFGRSKGMFKTGNHHFKFSPLGVPGNLTVSQIHHHSDSLYRTIDQVIEIEANTKINETSEYILEARIPKDSVLKEYSPQQGKAIGINYILSNPYLVERDDQKNIIKGFEPMFWSAASRDAAPMFWGKLELIGTLMGKPAIMDQRMTKNLTSFTAGDMIILTVLDPDRNTDKDSPQTIRARISGNITNEDKLITLFEIDPEILKEKMSDNQNKGVAIFELASSNDSDLFAAKINTQFNTKPSDDPLTISVQGKETITLEYTDTYFGPKQTNVKVSYSVTAKIGTNGTLQILSRAGKDIDAFPAGLRLFFKVVDEDLIKLESEVSETPNKVIITVSSKIDQEQIELIDEKNSGTFIGSLETTYSNEGKSGDGKLQVIGGDNIKAVYTDLIQADGNINVLVEASASVLTGNDGSILIAESDTEINGSFVKVKNFNAGDKLFIVVRDIDLNKDANIQEEAEAKIIGEIVKDSVTLKLNEKGTNSDTFIGILNTAYGLKPDKNDDLLEVRGKETIKAIYTDVLQSSGATMVAVTDSATVNTGYDGTISILRSNYLWDLESLNAGENLYIKVEDADLNVNPEISDQLQVSLVSEKTRDGETLTLQEKEPNSGVFLGVMRTEFSQQPAPDNILQVQGGERITAIYLDKLRSTGESNVPVTDSCIVNMGTMGKLSIYSKTNLYTPIASTSEEGLPNIFKAGEMLIIRLEDLDINSNNAMVDIYCFFAETDSAVPKNSAYDKESVLLTKVVGQDGIFAGEIRTEYGEKPVYGDNVLHVKGGYKVILTYLDAIDESGETQVERIMELLVKKGVAGKLDVKRLTQEADSYVDNEEIAISGLDSIRSFNVGDSLLIIVIDDDLNVDSNSVNYSNATLKGNLIKDDVQLVLQETSENSGIFTGTVKTERANTADLEDATLQVTEREIVTITYLDEVDDFGKTSQILLELIVRTGTLSSIIIVDENFKELTKFNAGQKIYFRLDDLVLSSLSRKTATITVRSSITKDSEEVKLEEIPYPSGGQRGQGIYIGSIMTSYGTKPLQDGILQVQGNEEISAIYNPKIVDPLTHKPMEQITAKAIVNIGNTGKLSILSSEGTKISNFSIGETLYFKLEDADLNREKTKIDTAEIYVVGEAVIGGRTIKLKETSEDSGIFTGSIETCYGRCVVPVSSDIQPVPPIELVGGEQFNAIYIDELTDKGETSVKILERAKANMIGIATYTTNPITVDGNMVEWPLENALTCGDEGSNLYIQWDDSNLYILAYVIDSNVSVPDAIKYWSNASAIELFINTNLTKTELTGLRKRASSYYVLWFCPKGAGSDGNEPFVGQSVPSIVWNYKEIERSVQIVPGERYILETKIPFTVFGEFNPSKTIEENIIGFNYIVHRPNAPALLWAPIPKEVKNVQPSNFGTLIFRK